MTTTQRIVLWCQRIALAILLIFPLTLALVIQIESIIALKRTFDVVMLTPIFLALLGLLVYIFLHDEKESDWLAVILVILLAVAVRMAMSLMLSTDLTSDVLDTHLFALDILSGDIPVAAGKYTYIPASTYKNMMGVTLAGFYAILGASVKTAKFFMLVFAGLTCGMIYKVGKDISNDHRVGLAAAILFATYPSLICFTGIPTSDHIDIFLLTLISLLWVVFSKSPRADHWYFAIPMYALFGALIGIVDWYRPIGPFVLLAFILAEVFSQEKHPRILQFLARLAILCICYFSVSDISHIVDERMNLVELPSSRQRLGETLLIGLDVKNKGVHNWDDQGIIVTTRERYKGNYSEANRYLLNLVEERLSKNHSQLPGLFETKFQRVWMNDDQLFYFSLIGSDDQEIVNDLIIPNQYFLVMITVLLIISTICSIVQPSQKQLFMMQILILGFAIALLITEAQTHYRTVLIPYMVILAALGMKDGIAFVTRIFTKRISKMQV
jgi:hypothetical protein